MAKLLLLSGLSVIFTVFLACEATIFLVGDSAGWDTSADLTSWPVNKIFSVGDVLLFQYSNYHTVNQVDKNGYDTCNSSNALLSRSDGNTSISLSSSGDIYFICSKLPHCFGGMKLKVNVRSNQTGEPPAASPESSSTTTLPRNSTSTANGDFLPPLFGGAAHSGRGCALFITLCFNFGALWWLFMMRF
ncbi:hypothetical protein KFK09_018481 [Dendrobium nobile]|uniref:Phytocyanin domain-containing protein n=1 Tax=Dendrobium nobile TaxID=94219 RepID=A0A8T3AVY4_DENNO|nr:hypothetical protein KFK09_018481 [Dendrobium nobile]